MATVGKVFTFRVYQRRRNHESIYRITLTADGWDVAHMSINGDSKPNGEPFLFMNFNQDGIQYPSGFGDALEWLFNCKEMSDDDLQDGLQRLADWVSATERSVPAGGVFSPYFGEPK